MEQVFYRLLILLSILRLKSIFLIVKSSSGAISVAPMFYGSGESISGLSAKVLYFLDAEILSL